MHSETEDLEVEMEEQKAQTTTREGIPLEKEAKD